jgi:hypothetical protein
MSTLMFRRNGLSENRESEVDYIPLVRKLWHAACWAFAQLYPAMRIWSVPYS